MGATFVRQWGDILTYSGRLVIETCFCGIVHAVPEEMVDAQKRQFRNGEKQRGIYCPLGHSWIRSGEGDAERLSREVERQKALVARLREEKEAERRSAAAIKGHQTRLKKRIAAGVCPCCNRSFTPLAAHMKSEHPDYGVAE